MLLFLCKIDYSSSLHLTRNHQNNLNKDVSKKNKQNKIKSLLSECDLSESIVEYLNIKDLCLLKSVSKEYAKTQLVFKNEEARNKEWFKIVNNGNSNEILSFLNNQNDEYSSLNLSIIQEKTERNLLQIALQQNNYKLFQMVLCSPDYNLYIPSFEEILTSFVTVRSCKNIKAKINIFQTLKEYDINQFDEFKELFTETATFCTGYILFLTSFNELTIKRGLGLLDVYASLYDIFLLFLKNVKEVYGGSRLC